MSLKFRSLLVVTYGRSGSTLLQGVLNAIPGCVIRGENHNFCHGLYLTWQALSRTERHCQSLGLQVTQRVEDPWYGAHLLSADRFLGVARNFVEQQLMGDGLAERPACLGFKEIRYLDIELSKPVPQEDYAQRLQGYLRFLGKIMPQLGIIFLTRSHDQVSRSGWWKNQPPELIRHHLEAFERVTQGFQAEGIGTFRLDYGDLLANGPAMQSLFAFLGAKYVHEDVAAVLGREHSFSLPASATTKMGMSPPAASPSWRAEVVQSPRGFVSVILDKPQPSPGNADHCSWNGVVVSDAMPQDVRLSLTLPGGQSLAAEWGRASPKVADRFPDRPWAKTARYRLPVFRLLPGEAAELMAHDREGDVLLARLERKS